jgi:hypothetical protein
MGKKFDNVIYGGLTVATAGGAVGSIGIAVEAFSEKKKVVGTLYTLIGVLYAGANVLFTKELITINKKKK